MENHNFSWENPLFLWPFSIAMLNYQRLPPWIAAESWVFFQMPRHIASPLRRRVVLGKRAPGSENINRAMIHGIYMVNIWWIYGEYMVNIWLIIWLVGATYPSEKWWSESQLGWWHSQYMGIHKTCSKPPTRIWINGICWYAHPMRNPPSQFLLLMLVWPPRAVPKIPGRWCLG